MTTQGSRIAGPCGVFRFCKLPQSPAQSRGRRGGTTNHAAITSAANALYAATKLHQGASKKISRESQCSTNDSP